MNDWRRIAKIVAAVGIVLGLIVLAWIPIGSVLPWVIVQKTFSYTVDQITRVSGWNVNLVKGLAAIALIPFGLAVVEVVRSRSRSRRGAQVVLALYFASFYLVMWRASANTNFVDGKPIKCYAMTPEGIHAFDDCKGRTLDPTFGVPVHPVTPEIAESIERERKGIRPKPIPLARAANLTFFDGATGRPLVWYYRWPDGRYDLFSSPGFHPELNEPLKPVTKDVVLQIESELRQDKRKLANQPDPAAVALRPGDGAAPPSQAVASTADSRTQPAPVPSEPPSSSSAAPNSATTPGKGFKDNQSWRRFQSQPAVKTAAKPQ